MYTSFFILLISAALAIGVVLSISYSVKAYKIKQDLKTFRVDVKNKVVTERLNQYKAELNQYNHKIKQLNEQLSVATSKKDRKRLGKKKDQLINLYVKLLNDYMRYTKLLNDYWTEISKSDKEKQPELYKYKQDFENYIRHSK